MESISLIPLIGIPIIVIGFALRFNPLLVVIVAGIITGLSSGISFFDLLEIFGEKFMSSRSLALFILILPVIALLEYYGLQEVAKKWISKISAATSSRILMIYFFVRESTAALGLLSLGGHVQTVRPLLAPMVEAATINKYGEVPQHIKDNLKAHSAACDNIALFFGEDIFIAFGAVILINEFLIENGISGVEPLQIGLWAIPTAIAALIIHFIRLIRLDSQIHNDIIKWKSTIQEGNK